MSPTGYSEVAKKQSFRLEFKNPAQRAAWNAVDNHDVSFLLGPAGCGKTFLAVAYAINEVLSRRKKKIILTRPIVEAGESLGFLPGDANEKVYPYMIPMYDSIIGCVGEEGPHKDVIDRCVEVAPIAFQRGRTFKDAVCIFDEAQNATKAQLKLFLTRFGENSKVIITGDPFQSDLMHNDRGLMPTVDSLRDLDGITIVEFGASSIVRHPLIGAILERLEEKNQ